MSDNNPMVEFITDAAGKAFEKAVEAISKRVRKAFKNQDAKEEIEFGIAYEDYLYNTLMKYGMVKTLINRYVPKPVESLYYPIGVDYDGQYIDTSKVTNLFRYGNKIIITGTGGIGKTIMMKYFFLNTAQETEYIPVMLELRSFNSADIEKTSIKEAIWDILCRNGFKLDKEYFEDSLRQYRYVFLLDGYDEIKSDRIETLTRKILEFCDDYPDNKYILTSRPMDSLFIGFGNFCEMSACYLSEDQAVAMIQRIDFDVTIKEEFCSELINNIYKKYESFASIPLLLTILLLTFRKFASIPDNMNDFYEDAFSTLYSEHDATKTFKREKRTGLGSEDFKTVFSYICCKSYIIEKYEFTEMELREYIQSARIKFRYLDFRVDDFLYELTISVCLLVKDGYNYRFQHRSFQEYFAAYYTCKLKDEKQVEVVTGWLEQSTNAMTDSYLRMLFNMQHEKVNSIIFAPVIKQIEADYKSYNFSIEFLRRLYDGIVVRFDYTILPNWYVGRRKAIVLQMVCDYNGFYFLPGKFESHKWGQGNILPRVLGIKGKAFNIKQAIKLIGEENLLQELKWLEKRIMFAFRIMESVEREIGRKPKTLIELSNSI